MGTSADIRAELPLDIRGHPMNTQRAESVEKVDCTTTAWSQVQVPDDVGEAVCWATEDGAAASSAFIFGGSRMGAPATGATVPAGMPLTIACSGAPFLYFKATGAACDVFIRWRRKDI